MKQHPSSIDHYIRHGWKLVPIPFGSKGPMERSWNTEDKCLTDHNHLPPNWGIGLAHAYSGTMALDIDAWDQACIELERHNINLPDLYNAPDAVVIDSGKAGHGKLLYAMPFGLTLPSKKLIATENGNRYNYLDFRCSTANGLTVQDVLPPSIHPETLQPYRWAGRGHWSKLPIIPDALLNFWTSLIQDDTVKDITDRTIATSWAEIQTVLYHIIPDCDRDQWIQIGMALHYAGYQDKSLDTAFALWDDWSSQSDSKYKGHKDLMRSWRSFQPNNGITIATLFHIAKEHGYERPRPSAAELFSAIPDPDSADQESHTGQIIPKSFSDIMLGYTPAIPSPEFTLFPEVLATRSIEVSDHIGCDPLVPLFAGLGAACAVANAESRLELMPGYQVPPVLWLMTIGDPADRKTPGARPMLSVLKELEQEDHQRLAQAKQEYDAQLITYNIQYKIWEEHIKATASGKTEPNDVEPDAPVEPLPPTPLRLVVSDVTSQKLVRHAADRPEGLLCHLDEMNSWIKNVTDTRSGENRSCWTRAYEADRYIMDRVGAGTIIAENFAISIFGNVQPDIFRVTFRNMMLDGMMQRFIPGVLDSNKSKLGHPLPDYLTSRAKWDMALRVIHGLPATTYHLSHEAHTSFRAFQQWYEDARRDFIKLGFSKVFMTSFGKIEGTTGRLILMFHLLTEPFNTTVSQQTADNVIQLVKNYLVPCYRYAYNNIVGDDDNDKLETWLFEHILYHCEHESEITTTVLRKAGRRQLPEEKSRFEKNEMLSTAMLALEDAKWVIRIEDYDRKGVIKWAINPLIATMFHKERKDIKSKRHKWKDIIMENATKRLQNKE